MTATKLTNSWHGLYFSAGWVAAPFRHLEIDHHVIYGITSALSYSLAAAGFFMPTEPLCRVKLGTGRLAALFGLTALPLGALFVSRSRLEDAARLGKATRWGGSDTRAGCRDELALIRSGEGRIRNYNRCLAWVFWS